MTFDLGVAVGLGVSALIALVGPLVFAFIVARRLGGTWLAWLIGAGTFLVSQIVLRLPWQIPLGLWLKPTLDAEPLMMWGWIALSSLTAGLFEETGRYFAYKKVLKQRTLVNGLMMGAGHGGIESIALVGLTLLGNLAVYVMLTHGYNPGIPDAQVHLIEQQFAKVTPGLALLGGVERIFAMAVHAGCSMLVLQCFVRGDRRWLGRSIVFHTMTNLVGVGAAKELGPVAAEVVVGLFAAAAVAWTVYFFTTQKDAPQPTPPAPAT